VNELTWPDVLGYIKGAGLGHLSTASLEGDPHVALVFVVQRGEELMFTMRTSSSKARNLMANPKLALMWQGNNAETYVWASAKIVHDQAVKSDLWNGGYFPFDLAHFFQREDAPIWCAVRVVPNRAVVMVQGEAGLTRRTWRAD
jgi:general stress protein 26